MLLKFFKQLTFIAVMVMSVGCGQSGPLALPVPAPEIQQPITSQPQNNLNLE